MRKLYDGVRASPVTFAILAGGLALQAVLVVLHGINKELLGDANFLALDKDNNLPSWITTALFVAAGLACGLLAWLRPRERVPLAFLAVVALLLSLEQMAQLHGELEEDLGDVMTLVIQPLLAVGLVAVVALAARGLPSLSKLLLWAAIACIAVSQLSSMINSDLDPPYALVVFFQTVEEVGEMLTAILLIAATAQPALDAIAARALHASSQARPSAARPRQSVP
jgi:hypothetical protein